jgi:glycosyltransferase involved in cell wall biosynthesis
MAGGPDEDVYRDVTAARLLVLTPFPPRLDAIHGGSRAIAELVERLARRRPVAILSIRSAGDPPIDPHLAEACALVREVSRPAEGTGLRARAADLRVAAGLLGGTPMWASRWRLPAFGAALREVRRDWRPAIVQAEYHLMAQYLVAAGPEPKKILRQLEPGAASAGDRAGRRRGPARLLGELDRRAWRGFERRAMAAADVVVALTERDRAVLAPLAGRTPIVCIPLGVAVPARPADPIGEEPPSLLFVGNYIHPPNADAAERLVREIFPRVRQRAPEARLRIVGPNPPPGLGRHAGVEITGEVPDVRPYLDRASVVVAPLRQGGGMRVKVAEALAAGKAVVATALAAEGLGARHGEQLLLADDSEAIAEAAATLLLDPAQRAALGSRARAWAMEHLAWDAPAAAFERLYDSLLAPVP